MDMHEISTDSQAAHMWIDLCVLYPSSDAAISSYYPGHQPDIACSSTVPKYAEEIAKLVHDPEGNDCWWTIVLESNLAHFVFFG